MRPAAFATPCYMRQHSFLGIIHECEGFNIVGADLVFHYTLNFFTHSRVCLNPIALC